MVAVAVVDMAGVPAKVGEENGWGYSMYVGQHTNQCPLTRGL